GRDVDAHDVRGTQPIAIVSRRFAAKAWPGADPIGKRFTIGQPRGAQTEWIAVAGVVSDIRYRTLVADTSRAPEDPDVYFPFAQRPDRALSLVIGANAAPATLIAPAREAVNAFDRDIPTFGERTFSGLVAARTASFRLSAGVMSFFGAVALLLAGLGGYRLINYLVSQRRPGVRRLRPDQLFGQPAAPGDRRPRRAGRAALGDLRTGAEGRDAPGDRRTRDRAGRVAAGGAPDPRAAVRRRAGRSGNLRGNCRAAARDRHRRHAASRTTRRAGGPDRRAARGLKEIRWNDVSRPYH